VIVPFGAGGNTDMMARLATQRLTAKFGQTFVVENRPSAGGALGTGQVATAAPDGYTLLFSASANINLTPQLQKLSFDPQKQLVPITNMGTGTQMIAIKRSLPVKTLPEFIAYAKANPGKINVGSFGARTVAHLGIELLKSSTGIDVVHVPYRGSAPLTSDLLSGRIQAGVDALPNVLPHARSGSYRALAVLAPQRTPALPDVPTVGETIKGYEVSTWSGIGVPKGTPEAIVERLNRETNAGLRDPGVTSRLAQVGAIPIIESPAGMRARIAADTEKWAKVIKAAGIQPD
jgi:tripartite-type tricarboxylate transporter receptor subunit TctC